MAKRDRLRIGVSVAFTDATSIWGSGLNQNLAFLVMLLRRIPEVEEVFLLNPGAASELPAALGFDLVGARLVRPAEVTHEIDLVIELGASLPLEWLLHVRALGAKIATFLVGHVYSGLAEGPVFGTPGTSAFVGTPWHEIWILAKDEHTSGALLRTVGRVPVFTLPHVWSPLFLQRQAAELANQGQTFGFVPPAGGGGWRVAIFEPNISVVKSCFLPMLACDHAYRRDPGSVDCMMVLNSVQMKEHLTFNRFASHLDLTRAGKASYEPRLAFASCMAGHRMNAVVSHQWENGQNYLYYDALYGGYPLVHNSEFLQRAGVGLHYPGFEAKAAGEQLLRARSLDASFWSGYRADAMKYLRTLAPDHPANVAAFRERILALAGGAS